MSDFKHEVQTKTDMMRLFRTDADLKKFAEDHPEIEMIKKKGTAKKRMTWLVPQWDDIREAYEIAKMNHIRRYGSN